MPQVNRSARPRSVETFYADTRNARRIVVLEPGVLGDTVHLLPALWTLRENYPDAEIHATCSPVGEKILRLAGCCDRLWPLQQSHAQRTLHEQFKVLRALRRLRMDASFNFNDNDRNTIHAAIADARHRVGQNRGNWHFWSRFCIPNWHFAPPEDRQLPMYEQQRRLLEACGMTLKPAKFNLTLPAEAHAWAAANVPAGAIHFAVNSSTHLREWPLDKWIELGRRLLADNPALQIVATGSPQARDAQRHEQLIAGVNNPRLKVLQASPIELAALFARCALQIGGDSGALHLALAMNTPTVALYREYPTMAEWAPRGPRARVLSVPCSCIMEKKAACDNVATARCMEHLPVETVFAAVKDLLKATS
jgi:ADP-heptose:LPS heptosyltransferase